jgi:hypothetical protein
MELETKEIIKEEAPSLPFFGGEIDDQKLQKIIQSNVTSQVPKDTYSNHT